MKKERENKRFLFRAYDIRGKYGFDLDPIMMFEIGISVTKVMEQELGHCPNIFVGYDIRKTSSMLAFNLIAGMTSVGAQVTFSGDPFPFGVVLFSGQAIKADFTSFVTASHLPPDYNGVKFYYGDGVGFPEELIKKIRDYYINGDFKTSVKDQSWKDIHSINIKHDKKDYLNFLRNNFSLSTPLKVVIDCGNGSASLTAPEIFKQCNYDVNLLWCDVDPTFPNRSPEPNAESLEILSKKVIEFQANFGVGFDGDGDRAVIVDDVGDVIPADEIGILIAQHQIKQESPASITKPVVLANIECSSIIETMLSDISEIIRIKVGHTYLTLEAKQRTNCIIGIESSGHFVFPNYFLFDDAMILPLIVGKMLSLGTKLSEMVKILPKMYKFRKIFPVSDEIKFKVIDALIDKLKDKYQQMNTIDGLSITFKDNGWLLIRASNTGPKIRLVVEARNEETMKNISEEFGDSLDQMINKITLMQV
ncbi:MAG: hypothetical protein ACXAC7_17495 [Candidatus Hodarchaeales archaeon]|jgi:phosphomannomutase